MQAKKREEKEIRKGKAKEVRGKGKGPSQEPPGSEQGTCQGGGQRGKREGILTWHRRAIAAYTWCIGHRGSGYTA